MQPKWLAGMLSLLVYVAWVIATYLFEGRVAEQLQPETVISLLLYFFIANMLVGIIAVMWALQYLQKSGSITFVEAGFRQGRSTVSAVVVGIVIGYLIYAGGFFGFAPPSLDPSIVFNGYVRALPVAIPSVLVCWSLVGTIFAGTTKQRGKIVTGIVGTLMASLFFGLYHLAIGPPFNTLEVVVFSGLVIGIATSIFFFLSRNVYGTIAFINVQVMFGILHDAQNTGTLAAFTEPLYLRYAMALIAVFVVIVMAIWFIRRKPTK